MSTTTTSTETAAEPKKFGVSSDAITVPRGDVKAELVFYAPPADGSEPYNYIETPPEGLPQRNYGEHPQEITIHDLRGRESDVNVNTHGFGTLSGVKSAEIDFADEEAIKSTYYPEVEKLLLDNLSGSHRVFIFDHTIRQPNGKRGPVNRAHIDQTTKSARDRVRKHLGDEAEELLKGRVRLINVWRPLNKGPVVASPLAYADSRSVPADEVVPVQHRYPTWTGETAGVRHAEHQQWYYWSGMTRDERILLQCYDSQDGARTPHSAFTDPRTKEGWPARESIEVRTLVFG